MTTIFAVVLVAHFIGDFVCQTDYMAVNKSKHWDALALHVLVYGAAIAATIALAVVAGAIPASDRWFEWVGINMAMHFVTDAITSRITSRLWFLPFVANLPQGTAVTNDEVIVVRFKPTRHWFFVCIGADQLIHMLTLVYTLEYFLS